MEEVGEAWSTALLYSAVIISKSNSDFCQKRARADYKVSLKWPFKLHLIEVKRTRATRVEIIDKSGE